MSCIVIHCMQFLCVRMELDFVCTEPQLHCKIIGKFCNHYACADTGFFSGGWGGVAPPRKLPVPGPLIIINYAEFIVNCWLEYSILIFESQVNILLHATLIKINSNISVNLFHRHNFHSRKASLDWNCSSSAHPKLLAMDISIVI